MAELLVRERYTPEGDRGRPPEVRTLEERLHYGVINLDKPAGPTSHQVVAWLKLVLGIPRAGHGGTLDPHVTGILPVTLDRATIGIQALLLGDKEYVGVLRLHGEVPRKELDEVFKDFTGEIFQVPPVRSAVKREQRSRTIHELELLEVDHRRVLFRTRCESGTYIRTLCHDMGEALGIGGNMEELRRTRTVTFAEKDSHTLHQVQDAFHFWKEDGEEKALKEMILPPERLVDHLPKVVARDAAVSAVVHGAPLAVPGVVSVDAAVVKGSTVAVMSARGEVVSLGRAALPAQGMIDTKNGVAVETMRVLMPREWYPPMWRHRTTATGPSTKPS